MNKLIHNWFSIFASLNILAGVAAFCLIACGEPVRPPDVIGSGNGAGLMTPSNFNFYAVSQGYGKTPTQIVSLYGEPCFVGDDVYATLYSYCVIKDSTGVLNVLDKTTCPVVGARGGGCNLLLEFTFFKDPQLVSKFGTGVAKVDLGAQW
jgi:hypothetical protein